METRKLGSQGFTSSAIALGCMAMSGTYGPADDRESIATLQRAIVAPLTRKGQPLGCRPAVRFKGRPARILLDRLCSIDKRRLSSRMGTIDPKHWHGLLLEMFA